MFSNIVRTLDIILVQVIIWLICSIFFTRSLIPYQIFCLGFVSQYSCISIRKWTSVSLIIWVAMNWMTTVSWNIWIKLLPHSPMNRGLWIAGELQMEKRAVKVNDHSKWVLDKCWCWWISFIITFFFLLQKRNKEKC